MYKKCKQGFKAAKKFYTLTVTYQLNVENYSFYKIIHENAASFAPFNRLPFPFAACEIAEKLSRKTLTESLQHSRAVT